MTLQEFKVIFLWEYFHRILGRIIGIFFLIPFIFFIYKKTLSKYLTLRLSIIFFLIIIQGVIGWYMVKSGLINNVSVSHYRLALHLFFAFIIFSTLIWMNYNYDNHKFFFQLNSDFLSLKILLFLIFFQIIIGAFVSGLDAGRIYQTWPLMNGHYFPNDGFVNNLFNFRDPGFVQFFHRNIAYLIFILTLYTGFSIYKKKMQSIHLI